MNKRQRIVQGRFLDNEEAVIKRLTQVYNKSFQDVSEQSQKLYDEIEAMTAELDIIEDEDEREILKSRIRSKVYQKKYQDGFKKQIGDILDNMHEAEYKTVSEYLDKCYEEGFVGAMYDLQGQGIPLCFPIDQEAVTRAVQLDSKISEGLYKHLGEDVSQLKKHITAQVSRGIVTGMSYSQIARNLSGKMTGNYKGKAGGSLAYAQRIARTEGHRIQCQAAMDCCWNAKDRGADIVKKWDSTLDARTRHSHALVDGEVKEIEEVFSNGLMFPGDPNGRAAEVINCRCALLEIPRKDIGKSFTKMNNFTKQLEEFESPEDYDEFKKAFFSKENRQYMNYVSEMEQKYKTKNFEKVMDKMTDKEYSRFTKLQRDNPLFNKNALTNNVKSDIIDIPEKLPVIAQGKNMIGEIDYAKSTFENDIETAMHAQGFDGLPQVVEYEEFKKAMEKSEFYAERTYSAVTQELADEYQKELYTGKWYVDCSEGGAQYGQGMYCAARFKDGKYIIPNDNKIGYEMSHYQEIGVSKGFNFHHTEAITLQPDAKIITLFDDTTDITNRYAKEYALKNAQSQEAKELIKKSIEIQDEIDKKSNLNFVNKVDWDEIDKLYDERDSIFNSPTYQNEVTPLIRKGHESARGKNEGVLAVEMGYDAINAQGHGESGSYTVILNRSKIIFCEGGSIYGN